ncbi:hypothetical protein XELAEV_18043151mg [Xenopus laevis]|uniref:Uncharacterized protein n=1 Tax=Xenopus laevis TaxID=8355 RepID=A0A974BWS9_XENLA|nr:hypothetical protein XELAEV_18043151mg [Xenopus laevis]
MSSFILECASKPLFGRSPMMLQLAPIYIYIYFCLVGVSRAAAPLCRMFRSWFGGCVHLAWKSFTSAGSTRSRFHGGRETLGRLSAMEPVVTSEYK